MTRRFRRTPDPGPAEDDMIRIRLLEYLNRCLDRGETQAPIRVMLDLLDPRFTPPPDEAPDQRADPITGCLPVTHDGKPPPQP